MNKQNKIKELEKKIIELNRRIRLCYDCKNKLNNYVSELNSRLSNNQISIKEHFYYLNQVLKNKSLNEWLAGYDNKVKIYSEKIKEYNSKIDKLSRPNKIIYLAPILIIAILIASFVMFKPEITGYAVFGEVITYTDKVDLEINRSYEYIWVPTKKGKLNSVMILGEIIGGGYAKVYLVTEVKDYLIYYKEPGQDKVILNNECMESCFLNLQQESYKLRFELKDTKIKLESITYFTVEIVDIDVYPKIEVIDFKPGLYEKKQFKILNSKYKNFKAVVYVEGNLNQSITLKESFVEVYENESFREIEYDVVLPNKLEPGTYKTKIIVRYVPDKPFTGTTPKAELEIEVRVPYETGYIEPSLEVYRLEDKVDFTISLFNLGKRNIEKAKAVIQIYNSEDGLVKKIETKELSVEPYEKKKLKASFKALTPDNYKVIATIYYDEKEIKLEKNVSIDYSISIKDIYLRNLGDSAELNIILENKIDKAVEDVNAEINLIDKFDTVIAKLQTNFVNIDSLEQGRLFAYIDYENIKTGYYDGKITVKYQNKTIEKAIKLKIQENYTEIVEEEQKVNISKIILIILFVLLLVVDVFWLVYYVKHKKQKVLRT